MEKIQTIIVGGQAASGAMTGGIRSRSSRRTDPSNCRYKHKSPLLLGVGEDADYIASHITE
jgi:hypothetical protein